MTDWPAFLARILNEPDDDVHRLVAADFLQEQGDEARAEFIRVQCALARIQSELRSDETCDIPGCECRKLDALRRRDRELLETETEWNNGHARTQNELLWAPEILWRPGSCIDCRFEYSRGFVKTIRTTAADWQRPNDDTTSLSTAPYPSATIGQEILRREPVEEITLTDCEAKLTIARVKDGDKLVWRLRIDDASERLSPNLWRDSRAALIEAMPATIGQWLGLSEVVPIVGDRPRYWVRRDWAPAFQFMEPTHPAPPPRV